MLKLTQSYHLDKDTVFKGTLSKNSIYPFGASGIPKYILKWLSSLLMSFLSSSYVLMKIFICPYEDLHMSLWRSSQVLMKIFICLFWALHMSLWRSPDNRNVYIYVFYWLFNCPSVALGVIVQGDQVKHTVRRFEIQRDILRFRYFFLWMLKRIYGDKPLTRLYQLYQLDTYTLNGWRYHSLKSTTRIMTSFKIGLC